MKHEGWHVSQKELGMVTPEEAIAEAMMVAQGIQLVPELRRAKKEKSKGIKAVMAQGTENNCRLGSASVIAFLSYKYADLFQHALLVESHADEYSWLANGWTWHDYFLVLGMDDVWYAGSPANYFGEKESRLTRVLKNRDLGRLLQMIENVEDGIWPMKRDVLAAIENLGGVPNLDGRYNHGNLEVDVVYYENAEMLYRGVRVELGSGTAKEKKPGTAKGPW